MPICNPTIQIRLNPEGMVQIKYPPRRSNVLARLLPKKLVLPMRTLELDTMGSFVWQLIDGERSVAALAQQVAKQYSLHPLEAEQAVALFIRQLGQRGILGLR